MISNRTREGLAAAKARGVVLGGNRGKLDSCRQKGIENSATARRDNAEKHAKDLVPTILELQASGASLREVAKQLTEKGIAAARGGEWNAAGVKRVIDRVAATACPS
jgi:DNA invertase Pin-like site-specific DNA recombinase